MGITTAQKRGEGVQFQRIRRITGYLVGDYQTRFNDAKKAEVQDRLTHSVRTYSCNHSN